MSELIVFPDVEALLVAHIKSELASKFHDTVSIATRSPKPTQANYVRLFVTGGARRSLAQDAPMITVESYGPTEVAASRRAGNIRAIIHALDQIESVQFYTPEEGGRPVNLPDTATGRIRYTATYRIPYRGYAVS